MAAAKKAFLFNGIGTNPEKNLRNLTDDLYKKFLIYQNDIFNQFNLSTELSKNNYFDRKIAEWITSCICDRIIFEFYTEKGIVPDFGAGHSIGLINASACFGAIQFNKAYELILKCRNILENLQKSNRKLDIGIIIGMDFDSVQNLINSEKAEDSVEIGSVNSSVSIMICGADDCISHILHKASEEGALKVIKYNIGIAFHNRIIKNFSDSFVSYCCQMDFKSPLYPIISAFDQHIITEKQDLLHENQINIVTPIRWDLTIKKLMELGVTEFYDMSADGAVSKFSRINKKKCRIYTLNQIY